MVGVVGARCEVDVLGICVKVEDWGFRVKALGFGPYIYVYFEIYIYLYIYIHPHICIYREREGDR